MAIGLARTAMPVAVSARTVRLLQVFVVGLLLAWIATEAVVTAAGVAGMRTDYMRYMDATQRWLGGGWFYSPAQIVGPHITGTEDAMYPPVSLALFVPFAVLPQPLSALLWYAIPVAILAGTLLYWRPAGWRLVAVIGCLAAPQTRDLLLLGNPGIWVAAFAALSTRWAWLSPLVLLKPSVFPFAIPGIRDRRWWLLGCAIGVGSLLLLPMTLDWVRVVLNARGPFSGLLYSLNNVPLLLVPWIAKRNRPAPEGTRRSDALLGVRRLRVCRG